jgi:hypothetical protein
VSELILAEALQRLGWNSQERCEDGPIVASDPGVCTAPRPGMAADETQGGDVVDPCDEGGEAPCFAHLLEDDEHEGDREHSPESVGTADTRRSMASRRPAVGNGGRSAR